MITTGQIIFHLWFIEKSSELILTKEEIQNHKKKTRRLVRLKEFVREARKANSERCNNREVSSRELKFFHGGS